MTCQQVSPSLQPPLAVVMIVVLLSGCCSAVADSSGAEQVHLAFTDDPSTIQVTYSTFKPVTASARYGTAEPDQLASGSSTPFGQDGAGTRRQYINRVNLTCLEPGERHVYQVLGPAGWSEVFWFTAVPEGTDWSPRLAVVADMELDAVALPFLVNDTREGMYDAAFHAGDFAYDLESDGGKVGDTFMRQLQPVAAHLPYMTCPGNRDYHANFSHYKERFSMPGETKGMYYSFDMGPVHVISISTEYYFFGVGQFFSQFNWLREDLMAASQPSARSERPWIVVFGHHPMYCTDSIKRKCAEYDSWIRDGAAGRKPPLPGLEQLLDEFGVDLAIWGHEHSYERTWPYYKHQAMNGTWSDPYHNPGAVVHIVTSTAGSRDSFKRVYPKKMPWTAFRSAEDGYARLNFHNASHMSVEHVAVSNGTSVVVDRVTIVKEAHLPYSMLKKTDRGYVPV